MRIGILRESKKPYDRRTPLVPEDCRDLLANFRGLEIQVQASDFRCYNDDAFLEFGCRVVEHLEGCDLYLGVKEVSVNLLHANQCYAFFSHTIKEQPYNQAMMQHMVANEITLYDYELMVNPLGIRTVAFGKWAGIVGAWHALRMWGIRQGTYSIPTAHELGSYSRMLDLGHGLSLPPTSILICGDGRVGSGARELLQELSLPQIPPEAWTHQVQQGPQTAFTVLNSSHMVQTLNGNPFGEAEFHRHPERYRSVMKPYLSAADILINTIYWDPRAPRHFQAEDLLAPDFKVQQIADISCDIQGSIPITYRSTTIQHPYYGVSKTDLKECAPFGPGVVDLMAVDNLPCELPVEASQDFSKALCTHFLPDFLAGKNQESSQNHKARLLHRGELSPYYEHLRRYAYENKIEQA